MANVKEVKFVAMLTTVDRYRHYHLRFKGNVLNFVVQYETKLNGKWYPVVRFDTGHGFAHRDLLNKEGKKVKMSLFITDYNEALTFAEHDIKTNWKIYKHLFLGGGGNGNKDG